ncbi:hypothetical protein UFOVP131_54 [uncultured Caudovirales phage]|uniref:Uncharacterized protein n=1 Tax=uncultured Caudovirales phage TaxID=2100421 RepID=A0A6J5LEQ1_9CAUD|nr:hypothetical protein UFOVP131_54 [uncultured Caudovirales phage]
MTAPVKFYYTNARLGGKTALLAGPFMDIGLAEHCIDLTQPLFEAEEPRSQAATFGVMSVTAFAGYGIYNRALRANGIDAPVPEN